MTSSQYERPPITEAVIEIRLEKPLSEKVVKKIHNRLKNSYESSDTISSTGIKFDAEKKEIEQLPTEFVGYRLSSKDRTDIVQIKANAMICSRLAPYNGWENFEPRARKNWGIWRKEIKQARLRRIGLRYINRLDIPYKKENKIDVEDYLTVVPKFPEPSLIRVLTAYTMQIAGPFSIEDFHLNINSNVVKSPLIDNLSIVLDLDLSLNKDLPHNDDKIWELINKMREYKNNAFEMCITDKARELFV